MGVIGVFFVEVVVNDVVFFIFKVFGFIGGWGWVSFIGGIYCFVWRGLWRGGGRSGEVSSWKYDCCFLRCVGCKVEVVDVVVDDGCRCWSRRVVVVVIEVKLWCCCFVGVVDDSVVGFLVGWGLWVCWFNLDFFFVIGWFLVMCMFLVCL